MSDNAALLAYPVALILLGLAGLHLYWGLGGYWPGTDEASLVERVVGRTQGMKAPTLLACMIVATCLAGVACLLFLRLNSNLVPHQIALVPALGLYVAAAVFILRGVAGYLPKIFDYAKATPFYDLNLAFYSPLCILIGATLVTFNLMRA
jgi:uncharacterized membrane protein SpoIIM required for sporulation